MSKSGSYRYTSDKVNDNDDEKDTEKQSKKSEDKAPPSRSYHFTNSDDDDDNVKKSKHDSDNNMLSPHSYGYDNPTLDNDESGIKRKNSLVEHRIFSNKGDNDFIVKRKRRRNVSYETIVWVVFFVCNVVILIDRFTGNGDVVFGRKSRLFLHIEKLMIIFIQ